MPGGGKGGSSPSGNTTTTTINPTQQAQLPFLTGGAVGNSAYPNAAVGWNQALNLAAANPLQYFPGQSLADFNPAISQGYYDLINTAQSVDQTLRPAGNNIFYNAATGLMSGPNSPAYNTYSSLAGAGTQPQLDLHNLAAALDTGVAGQAGNIARGNLPQDQNAFDRVASLQGLSDRAMANPYAVQLGSYAYTPTRADSGAQGLLDIGNQYVNNPFAADPYIGQIGDLGQSGSGALGHSYALGDIANAEQQNRVDLGGSNRLLGLAGLGGLAPNLATRDLAATAGGAFLGANPYLNSEFAAASRPVVNAYQTATAPQADSTAEASGRYGSGFVQNNRDINQQDLGKTLGDMGANLYGQDYANERGLMTSAQGTLANAINTGLGIAAGAGSSLGSNALGAGQLRLAGQSAAASAQSSAAQIAQNELQLRGGLLENAGTQLQNAENQGINALSAGSNVDLGLYNARAGMLSNAGSLYGQGVNSAIGAQNSAGNLDLGMIDRMLSGVGAESNAYTSAGQLTNASLQGVLGGASGLQSGYDTGNRNALIGLGMLPQVTQANYTPAQMAIQGGQGLTGINQAQINDAMSRFYGNQQAPWQTESQYMNLVGQPTSGSSSTQQPFFTNPLANALGAATGGLGLVNGLGSAFGSGGLFGGGAAAGGLAQGASGAASLGALAADPAIFGTDVGAAFGGGGSALGSGLLGALAWIVCTELMRQGRMPKRYWISGSKVFAAYPEAVKRGYYLWAIPSVRHLRKRPNSLYSRLLERAFNWRAENIAAHAGIKGARKLRRGAAVTAVLYPACFALGSVCRESNWRSVYRPAAK